MPYTSYILVDKSRNLVILLIILLLSFGGTEYLILSLFMIPTVGDHCVDLLILWGLQNDSIILSFLKFDY